MLIHRLHKNMVSLQCEIASGFSKWTWLKMPIHILHKNMVSLQCEIACVIFKVDLAENADPQTSQVNGFSPVCVRMWPCKWELLKNAAPQTSQENGFSPE